MAYFRAIGSAICNLDFPRFGSGNAKRDFTFIDDVIDSVILLERQLSQMNFGSIDVVNIGGGNPISINEMLGIIKKQFSDKPHVVELPKSEEDLEMTYCDSTLLNRLIGKDDFTSLEDGLMKTIDWFKGIDQTEISAWL